MTPEVSVLMACRNGEAFVGETIRHLLTLADSAGVAIEVIVVDDGSTDSTRQVVGALPVRLVTQDALGLAAARNRGLRLARAPVIGTLDSDDRWTADVFDALLPLVRSVQTPLIAQGRIRDFWPAEGLGPPYEGLCLGSALFTASVFAEVGPFDESLPRMEDYEWFVRAYDRRVPQRRVRQTALHYHQRAGSLTASAARPDPLTVRVHRSIMERRRSESVALPPGFPSVADYLGVVPAERDRHPPTQPVRLHRMDSRSIAIETPVRAISCVRNERERLPALLDHHRRLGVESFFVVDNGSTDGSADCLLAQPDVHLWTTEDSFGAARCGTDWVLALIDEYGSRGWNLVIDADELFVYLGYEHTPITDLCARLDAEGANAMLAVVVDMYSDRAIADTDYEAGAAPLDVCAWFDRQPWSVERANFWHHENHPGYFGGPRDWAFGAPPDVDAPTYYTQSGVRLFRGGRELQPSQNFHWMDNASLSRARAAVLHWKYTSSFADRVRIEAVRGEHWSGASQYQCYVAGIDARPDLSLYDPSRSIRYVDSDQLARLGILAAAAAEEPAQ